jgi:hypothetical protein
MDCLSSSSISSSQSPRPLPTCVEYLLKCKSISSNSNNSNSNRKKPNIRPHVMPMDSNYYQFVLSLVSTGARWGKACDDFFKKLLKANSKGNRRNI